MTYFSADFLKFFRELAANNNRDWFQDNKKRYEESVKKPFHAFVGEAIAQIHKKDKTFLLQPSDAIFRINRDIRFSKDKSPYKLNTSAIISREGRKDHSYPGLYIELGPEKLAMAGGSYEPDKDLVYNIREAIAADPRAFRRIISKAAFTKYCGEIRGEVNKVIPAEFREVAEKEPLIRNKQFYFWKEHPAKVITSNDLMPLFLETWNASKEYNDFLLRCAE